ncbi:MAG: HAD family phosphatase [Oscillospiraceae bacterium]|nr:HAD family phosphatase [Oscillospiraceae bacterium]
MDLRCLLFDLDGTLLRSDKTISPRTLRALEACRERGIKIGICTNRSENRAKPFLDQLGPEVIISSGGALVRYDGEIIFRAEFSPPETRRVLDRIQEICGVETEITVDGETAHYWNFKSDPGIMDKSWSGSTYCDFSRFSGSALKLCAKITDETFPALKAALPDCDCVRFSGEDWCKITKANATKENALRELCRVSGLSLAGFAAFGDDTPDIGMLRLCGLGVAMGNAVPAVKAAADVVIGTNDEDGIAEWLEEQFQ